MKAAISALLLIFTTSAFGGEDKGLAAITAAHGAAMRWVEMVDRGEFRQSYDSAAATFKSQITESKWVQAAQAARGRSPVPLARQLTDAQRTRNLPNVPAGCYVILTFTSQAPVQPVTAEVTETVTLVKDGGTWRVTGYFVK